MTYSWYDYWEKSHVDYYAHYYEYYYWPKYYGVSNTSFCDNYHSTTMQSISNSTNSTVYNSTNAPIFNITNQFDDVNSTNNSLVSDYYAYSGYNYYENYCDHLYNGTFPPSPYIFSAPWFSNINTWISVTFTLGVILTILSFIVAILFFYQIYKILKTNHPPNKVTLILSSFCMTCHLIYNTTDIIKTYFHFFDYKPWPNKFGLHVETIWESFWCVAKISLYCLFAYRYYNLSAPSLYNQSSNKQRIFIYVSIISLIIVQVTLTILFCAYHYNYQITPHNDSSRDDKRRIYLTSCWIIMALDFVLIGIIGYLIVRIILKLVIAFESHNDNVVCSSSVSGGSLSPQVSENTTIDIKMSDAESAVNTMKILKSKRNSKQMDLLQVTTRIALLCFLSLCSSMCVQLFWLILDETEYNNVNDEMAYVAVFLCAWLWSVDGLINMFCIYFSMGFAKKYYRKVCADICKCHGCFLRCIMGIVSYETQKKRKRESKIIKIESTINGKSTNQMVTLTLSENKSIATESVTDKSVEIDGTGN